MEIAVAMCIMQFNQGDQALIDATAAVVPHASPSCQLSELADKMDKIQLWRSNAAAKLESKAGRKRRSLLKLQAETK